MQGDFRVNSVPIDTKINAAVCQMGQKAIVFGYEDCALSPRGVEREFKFIFIVQNLRFKFGNKLLNKNKCHNHAIKVAATKSIG